MASSIVRSRRRCCSSPGCGTMVMGEDGVDFSLTELRVLAGLAQGMTVSQIGESLGMGHSSVSKAIHVAETRAGFELVEQHGRRIYLTSAGVVLAERAQRAVQSVDEINR